MIDVIKQQFTPTMSNEEKINRARELLQILTLKIIYDKGYFRNLAFVGGTALRVLFGLRRFSEDLDFSVIDKKGYSFPQINSEIERELKLNGLDVEAKAKEDKTVQSSLLKFSGLLKSLGLSGLEAQKFSIKIEADSNPPAGWNIQTTLINKVYLLSLTHLDLPSLYATKLHACFFRKYIKGRDFYDLLWYLGRKLEPNYLLLNNAIQQTQGVNLKLNKNNLKGFLIDKLKGVDFTLVKKDVERFLEDKSELNLLNFSAISNSIT